MNANTTDEPEKKRIPYEKPVLTEFLYEGVQFSHGSTSIAGDDLELTEDDRLDD